MNIKTVTTSDGVNVVDFGSAASRFYWIENLGSTTVYVSGNENIVPDGDNVKVLSAGCGTMVENLGGKVYILGAGKFQITNQGDKFPPFRNAPVADGGVMASGNPVTLDGLQGGVPFSEMVVSGRNLLKYPYVDTTKTVAGITFTDNGDGSITASGTHNGGATTAYFGFFPWWANANYDRLFLPKGNTVSLKSNGLPSTYNTMLAVKSTNNGADTIKTTYAAGENAVVYTATQDCYIACGIMGNSNSIGQTVDFTVRPQLELGSVATAYEQPITGRELTVNVCGKNLLQKMVDKTIGGLHYSPNDDGSVSVTGTQTAENYPGITSTSGMLLKTGNYTLSGGTERLQITALDIDANTAIARAKIAPATFSIDTDKYIRIYVYSAGTYNSQTFDDVIYPQLELGSTATPYEPYHGSTTTITPDTNPYTIPNDIRQQYGYNVISVSEGELSVTGVRKNAAVKKIWDKIDELTTAIIVSNGETIE